MKLNRLNFRHLFYFWRVAKVGHLTRAAEEIPISQSALSTQIRQLEEQLNEPLFQREGKKLVLTEVGQQVFTYAENIFNIGQEMLGWLQGHSKGMDRVRIGSVATMSRNFQENWIRPLMASPNVAITVESGLLDDLVERLLNHQLDVVLANEPVSSDPDRPLYSRFLGSQSISLVGPSSRWQHRHLRLPEDLDAVELAIPSARQSLRARFDALCYAANVNPVLRAEIDDMTMLRLIARDSGWLTVLPEVVVQDELSNGALVIVGQSSQLEERFYAITTRHHQRVEALEKLLADTSHALV